MSLPTYTEALDAADIHRIDNGDDVVQHLSEDHGSYLTCDDCGWALGYIEQNGIDDE